MRKFWIAFCVLCLVLCQTLSAQKPHSDLYHELGVNAGPVSLTGSFIYGTIGFWSGLGGSIGHKPVDMALYGHYGIHYHYQVKPWCQIGVKAMVEGAKWTHYSDTLRTSITAVDRDALITLMPSVRFTYFNRPWIRLYAGADVGCAYLLAHTTSYYQKGEDNSNDKDNNFIFAFNVTAFGLNVGKRFYGLFELNAGYDAIVKFGMGARF